MEKLDQICLVTISLSTTNRLLLVEETELICKFILKYLRKKNVHLYSQSFEQTLFEDIVNNHSRLFKLTMIYINEYQT